MEVNSETLEKVGMGAIADGVSIRVQRHGELQADNGGHPRGQVDRQGPRLAELGAKDPVRADADPSSHLPSAETTGMSCSRELPGDALP